MKTIIIKWLISFIIEKIIEFISSLFEREDKEGKEDKKPEPKPEPKPKPEPEPEKEIPVEVELPIFDDGDFIILQGTPFFAVLEKYEEMSTSIRHRGCDLVLINTKIGDKIFAEGHLLQTIGTVRLSITLNSKGVRYINIQRDGMVVAGMNVIVK